MTNLTQVAPAKNEGHSPQKTTASSLIIPPGQKEINVHVANLQIERLQRQAEELYDQAAQVVAAGIARGEFLPGMNPEAIRLNRAARYYAALARSIMRMMEARGITPDIQAQGYPSPYVYNPPAECACGTIFDPASCPVCSPHLSDDEILY